MVLTLFNSLCHLLEDKIDVLRVLDDLLDVAVSLVNQAVIEHLPVSYLPLPCADLS